MDLATLGEFGLIEAIRRRARVDRRVWRLGIGDDAAILRARPREDLVLTTDALVEGVHIRWSTTDAISLGAKSLAVNLSDVGAMGANALGCLLTLGVPQGVDPAHLDGFLAGLLRLAHASHCPLVGGDTVSSPLWLISVTVVGSVARGRALLRSGARPGDRVVVTGTLGAAAEGVRLLQEGEYLEEVFLRVASLHASRTREEGLRFLLDLAMEKIRCESGSVFLSQLGSGDLSFAVARGPKAAEILRLGLKVPMGVGIVGFCVLENVCLAVSDVEKDPRFYRAISQALGYSTRSLLCAPIASRGRVHGALELVNKLGERPFDQADLAVLSYLSFQAGEFLDRVEA